MILEECKVGNSVICIKSSLIDYWGLAKDMIYSEESIKEIVQKEYEKSREKRKDYILNKKPEVLEIIGAYPGADGEIYLMFKGKQLTHPSCKFRLHKIANNEQTS